MQATVGKMSAGILRMHEQLRAVWKTKDKDVPFVWGMLLTGTGNEMRVAERWFTVMGHALFYCLSRDSPEYSGVFLTDIFTPVVSRVDERTLNSFNATDKQGVALHLKGIVVTNLEVLLCPASSSEKKLWLERLHGAGLKVPTRSGSDKSRDGREKVVVIGGNINDSLYLSPPDEVVPEGPWKLQWQKMAKEPLKLPNASDMSKRMMMLGKLVSSEERYVQDLSTLVNQYYKQFKIAVASGHVAIQREQLDTMFLNCESLLTFHQLLYSHMKKAFSQTCPLFGELLQSFIPHMNLYVEFVKNHKKSIQVLEECLTISSFTAFLENHHFSHDCEAQQLRQLLNIPVIRLDIYWSFLEGVLTHTSEEHVDFRPLGTALRMLQDLKRELPGYSSELERQDRMLSILRGVGNRGFILMEPDCELVLEGDMFLPPSSKWVTGSMKRRPIHCYLYTNALVVIALDKKVKHQSQVFPLCGASVYEHVARNGEVTYAKDQELEIRAMKLYSPNGPRNGVVIIFITQSSKALWLKMISQRIYHCTVELERTISPIPPLRRASSVLTLTSNPPPSSKKRYTPPPIPPRPNSLMPPKYNPRAHDSSTTAYIPRSTSMVALNAADALSPRGKRSPVSPPVTPRPPDYYSIPTLFTKLTDPPDPYYAATFLLTYRMFTNAHEVLDALVEAHRKDIGIRKGEQASLSTLSLRFFNTLKIWVNKYYVDFHHDVTLKRVLVVYLNNVRQHRHIHEKECSLADSILRTVSQRGHIPLSRKSKLRVQIPKIQKQVPTSFAEISAETAADQLTWMEHEIYSRIKPYEFLQQKWTKKNRHELAPNICYVIHRFNQVTRWILKEVLSKDQARHRAIVVQKMLQMADLCLQKSNYVTVFQITAALSSGPIKRLKKTWELLPQSAQDLFAELHKLTTLEGSSKVYREKQKSSPSPSVPYIGPYLSQLISIEVGMPTFVKDPPEHVNFSKLVKLAAVIEEVTRFQNPRYNLEADGAVLAFFDKALDSAADFDDDQRYLRSMIIEPREEFVDPPPPRPRNKSFSKILGY